MSLTHKKNSHCFILKVNPRWLWEYSWSSRFTECLWRSTESYQVYFLGHVHTNHDKFGWPDSGHKHEQNRILPLNTSCACGTNLILFHMVPLFSAEYWKTTTGSRRKATRPKWRVWNWKWTTFKMRAASCKTCSRRKVMSTRTFAKRCPDWAVRTRYACLTEFRFGMKWMYECLHLSLFDLTRRLYQSWSCRFQSCKDKRKNLRSI